MRCQACKIWNVPAAPAVENQAVTSDVPTLVFSGEFDPITPPAYGQASGANAEQEFLLPAADAPVMAPVCPKIARATWRWPSSTIRRRSRMTPA